MTPPTPTAATCFAPDGGEKTRKNLAMGTDGVIERKGASKHSALRARWNAALVFLTAACALPCVIGLVDAVWYQWRDGPAWVPMSNPHSGSLLLPLLAAFIGAIVLAPVLCVDLISQDRRQYDRTDERSEERQ